MTIKFTKTGVGAEEGIETLLFEFQNHESPKEMPIKYITELATQKYVGSLQTNQLQGAYLQPISWEGQFVGNSLNYAGQIITAKERADELGRLQGRVIKFWYEGIKQLVIIHEYEVIYMGYNKLKYKITLQPHDIQIAIKPSDQDKQVQNSLILISDDLGKNTPSSSGGKSGVPLTVTQTKEMTIAEKKVLLLQEQDILKDIKSDIAYFKQAEYLAVNRLKEYKDVAENVRIEKINQYRNELANLKEDEAVYETAIKNLQSDINLAEKSQLKAPKKDGVADKLRYTK